MRRWLLRVVAVLVTLTPGAVASAQTNAVPPPVLRTEMAQTPAATGPVPATNTPMQEAVRAVKKVNSATGNIYRIGTLAAPSAEALAEASKHQSLFRGTGYALTGIDAGIDVANGRYMRAEEKVTAAVIDRCIDVAIGAACAAVSAPTAELGAAPCVAAVSAAKFCAETYFGGSAGTGIVNGAKAGADWVSDKLYAMRDAQEASRQDQQAQFHATQSNNDQSMMQVASNPASGGGDDGSAMMMAAMMSGVGAVIAANNQPPVPYRAVAAPQAAPAPAPYAPVATPPAPVAPPSPAPTGCHPGHNESAHPGGCHSAPKGSSK